MAIKLQDKTNVLAPGGAYPYGNIKDNPGDNSGTPVNVQVYADFHQFFAKVLAESGVTASGLPDNLTNGFDYFQALWQFGNLSFVTDLVIGLLGSYTTNDLIVLYGCAITPPTIPGTSAITAGAIYYNGNIYKVPAASVVTTGSQTLVFKINSAIQPNTIYLTNANSGTGIANYNQASVKAFTSTTAIVGLIAGLQSSKADKSQLLASSISGVGPTSYPTPGTDTVVLTLTPSASKAAAIMKYTFMGYLSNDVADTAIVKIKKNGTTIASTKTTVPIGQINFCLTWIDAYAANDTITATVAPTADGGDITNYILICESLNII